MLGTIISLVIAAFAVHKVKGPYRFIIFPVVLLLSMPIVAYVVVGTQTYVSGMTGAMVAQDVFSVAVSSFQEGFALVSGTPTPNYALGLVGVIVALSVGVAFAQAFSGTKKKRRH